MKYHFFIEPEQVNGQMAQVTGSDVNHIRNVLRMRVGEEIVLSDGVLQYNCHIEALETDRVLARVDSTLREERELPAQIILLQGIAKGERMDTLVQKSVELGVAAIVPLMMERTIVRLDAKKAAQRQERWQSIAESAAKQSGRGLIPAVEPVTDFARIEDISRGYDHLFMAYELAEGMKDTREAFSCVKAGEKVGIIIGPEGGITHAEAELAIGCGARAISLGRRILRTETAGPAALAMLGYVLERE